MFVYDFPEVVILLRVVFVHLIELIVVTFKLIYFSYAKRNFFSNVAKCLVHIQTFHPIYGVCGIDVLETSLKLVNLLGMLF